MYVKIETCEILTDNLLYCLKSYTHWDPGTTGEERVYCKRKEQDKTVQFMNKTFAEPWSISSIILVSVIILAITFVRLLSSHSFQT